MSLNRTPPRSSTAPNLNVASGTEAIAICTICGESLTENQDCLILRECSHLFHRTCIENYLASSAECPTCKRACELSELRKYVFLTDTPLDVAGNASMNAASNAHRPSVRGKPRGGKGFHYNTRSKSGYQDPNTSFSAQNQDIPNTPGRTASQIPQQNNNTTSVVVDYDQINRMIEQSVTRLLSNLNMIPQMGQNTIPIPNNNQNFNPQANTRNNSGPHISPFQNADPQSSNNLLNISHLTSSSFSTDKVSSIVHSWHLTFDGSPTGLSVEEFLYRLRSLTIDNFNGDFSLICKHLQILLTGKAKNWYWRYRKQVLTVEWDDFCEAIRSQYRDFKTSYDVREEIRNRKQKPGETFDSFYEVVSSIVDRLSTPMTESELVEILTRNLRPEIRQDLLYVYVDSISQLRKLVQKRENFLNDEHVRRNLMNRNTNTYLPRRQIAEIDNELSNDDHTIPSDNSIDAIKGPQKSFHCWNCGEIDHHWEDCLQERKVFCYGCGTKEIYKPNCPNCLAKKASYSKNVRTLVPNVEQP